MTWLETPGGVAAALNHYDRMSNPYQRGKLVGATATNFDAAESVRARARAKARQWATPAAKAYWLGVARGAWQVAK